MPQHDYVLNNQAGAAFRADNNLALLAIVQQNSGATEPTAKWAYMFWADTATGLWKQRNAANSAWITIGTLADTNLGHASLAGTTAFTAEQTFNAGVKFSGSGTKGAKTSKTVHATTMNIWDGGDTVEITGGATTITDLANAPQAGLWRMLLVTAAHTFTNNSTIEVHGAANYICSSGDVILAYAKSATVTVIIPLKKDGSPIASASIPVGTIIDFAGDTAPAGYIKCIGQAVSRTVTYDALFAVIGTTYGTGDGSTTYNLPDLRRRVTVGKEGTGTSELGNSVGDTGGEEDHALSTAELASHTHTQQLVSFSAGSLSGINATTATSKANAGTPASSSAGSGDGHNTIQPSIVVTKCIKY